MLLINRIIRYLNMPLRTRRNGSSCQSGQPHRVETSGALSGADGTLYRFAARDGAQIRPRSGLALKKGITVLNSPGTIDADYRGEICIILVNLSSEPFEIRDGERIAQMVVASYEQAGWKPVESLDDTERGAGGFGHSGEK